MRNLGKYIHAKIITLKVYSRTTTKSIPVLPKMGCQQNGTERGVVQDWFPNEKMNGGESLPLPARRDDVSAIFLKYSSKGRLSSSYVGIWNILSEICYDDIRHYQLQSEHRRI